MCNIEKQHEGIDLSRQSCLYFIYFRMYCKNEKRRARTGLKRIDVLEPAVEMPMTEEVSSSELKYEQGTSGRLRNVC